MLEVQWLGKPVLFKDSFPNTFNGDAISSMISSNIDYNLVIQDLSVKMTIWDTVGQEK